LLLGARKIEAGHVGAGVDQRLPSSICSLPPVISSQMLFWGSSVAALIDIGELDGLADADGAAVRLLLADDHFKQGGLAGAVGADHTHDAAGRQTEAHVVHQQAVAEGFAHILRLR
jgi:hypothetical protein